jgi:uncharacterized protein YbjT (DUF2867 family)
MKIVINTPAGNIGRVVTEKLLQAKQDVVIITRHPEKVQKFIERGAKLVQGSTDDPAVLDSAMKGADALFWLTPIAFDQPNYIEWARRTGKAGAEIAKKNAVKRVVLISSVGAQHEVGVGPIGCLLAIENAFKEAVPNVVSLRCGSFMENFFNNVGTIVGDNTIYSPYPASKKIPIVATRDIAQKAVEFLLDRSWGGHQMVGVHGPEDLDQTQAVKIISEGIGRPVRFVEVSIDQAKQGMIHAGMPPFFANLLGDMYTGFHTGLMERSEPRTPETTTSTTLLEFARTVLKPAVDGAQKR